MAAKAPKSVEVTEYQFKLHKKDQVFNQIKEPRSDINLLATASNYGLLFIGDPNKPELKVIRLENLINSKENDEKLHARIIHLPGIPHCIAVSSDGSLLAVNFTLNGSGLLSIYSVPAFLSGNVLSKINMQVSGDGNVQVTQILWNPVIPNTLAVVLNNGSLGMYNLKDSGFEFHSIDKREQVKCACWSVKGKQIVVGFPGGKLVQYKPDLKPARIIACPDNVHQGPFNTIAIQWLSNYQFAAVFTQEGEDMSPALYIINAPKVGNPTYINYYDISYSGCGLRNAQVFLIHIQPWNILLMTTSNSMEAGILGTKETGDNPTWLQYTIGLDEARLELPLTRDKQETFPIGFALETGTTHQLTIAENKIPVMPMIHVLSTHGLLISFNFLNLNPGAPGICSPPQPISDLSGLGLFKPIDELLGINTVSLEQQQHHPQPSKNQASDLSFAVPSGATSTPAMDRKPKSIFGDKPTASMNIFGNIPPATTNPPSSFGIVGSTSTAGPVPAFSKPPTSVSGGGLFGSQAMPQTQSISSASQQQPVPPPPPSFNTKPTIAFGQGMPVGSISNSANLVISNVASVGQSLAQNKQPLFGAQESSIGKPLVQKQDSLEKSKPLYTIPPTYTNSSPQQQQLQQHGQFQEQKIDDNKAISSLSNESYIHDIIKELIKTQIESFELELKELSTRSKDINISIGNMEESKQCTKRLNDLQELTDRTVEKDMESDIQILRHSLNESFAMIVEVKSKLNTYKNPELSELAASSSLNQTNRRQMAKLKSLVATNDAHLQVVQQQIDAQWASYQDLVRKNAKTKMHIPGLEGIYQTLTKQKDILARERIRINYIKSKLGIKGILDDRKSNQKVDVNVESLVDSILSMSLADQVKKETSRLTPCKLNTIREALKGRKISKIKPQRPDRIGLNSEVILETRIRTAPQRDGAATRPEKMEKMRIPSEHGSIAKPTPTKATPIMQTQIKKIEPKPTNLQHHQPKETVPQKPIAIPKASTLFGSGEAYLNQQQTKPFGLLPEPLNANFMRNPTIGKSGEFTITLQPDHQTSTPPLGTGFMGLQPNVSIFATPKPESNRLTGTIFGGGENKGLQQQASADLKGVDMSQVSSSSTALPTFGIVGDKIDGHKEQVPISFSPKVIGGEVRPSLSFGSTSTFPFSNKSTDTVDQKSAIDEKPPVTEDIFEVKRPIFSPVNLGIPTELKQNDQISPVDCRKSENTKVQPAAGGTLFSPDSLSSKAKPIAIAASKATPPVPASISSPLTLSASIASSPLASSPFNIVKTESLINSSVPSDKPLSIAPAQSSSAQIPFDLSTLPTTLSITPVSPKATTAQSTTISTAAKQSTFSFATLGSSLAPTVSSTPTTQTVEAPIALTKSDNPTDSLLENLNICKPETLENVTPKEPTSNIFGGSLLSSTAFSTTTSTADAKSIFGSAAAASSSIFNTSGTPSPFSITPVATTFSTAPLALTSTSSEFLPSNIVSSASDTSSGPIATSTTSVTPASTWGGFGSTPIITTSTSAFVSSTSLATSVFGGVPAITSSVAFGGTVPTAAPFAGTTANTSAQFGTPTPTTATSVFAGTTQSGTSTLFGTTPNTTATQFGGGVTTSSPFAITPGTTSSSIFCGSPSIVSSGSIFGGIPKPDQSIFTQAATSTVAISPFASSDVGSSLFRSPSTNQPASLGNIFRSSPTGAVGFGGQPSSTGSIFGGGGAAVSQPSSPFGGGTTTQNLDFGGTKSEATTNVFNTSPQGNQGSGGSLFGSSSFGSGGQTTSSIFGGSTVSSGSNYGNLAFGQVSPSTFGSGMQQNPPFGGGGTSVFSKNVFGSTSPFETAQTTGFGSISPGGSFAQGGASVAQTGFGSPGGSFANSSFGAPPGFVNPPAFGAAPVFGGGASTFGTPQNTFGSFGANSTGAFSPPTQKNALFESLASADTGLSFGNIAQKSNPATTKPQFGGSQFSTWR